MTEKTVKLKILVENGKDGLNGKDADESRIEKRVTKTVLDVVEKKIPTVEQIVKKIPTPKDGKDGKDAPEVSPKDVAKVLQSSKTFVKSLKGDKGQNGSPDTPQEIVSKISSLKDTERLSYESLKDTPNLELFRRGGGGGPNLVVLNEGVVLSSAVKTIDFRGANVDVVDVGDGEIVVTVTGGSGGGTNVASQVIATKTQAGDNVTFSLTQLTHTYSTVLWISRNGIIMTPNDTNLGYSQAVDTITVYNADISEPFIISYTYA